MFARNWLVPARISDRVTWDPKVWRERSDHSPERAGDRLGSLELDNPLLMTEPWHVGLNGRFADALVARERRQANLVCVCQP